MTRVLAAGALALAIASGGSAALANGPKAANTEGKAPLLRALDGMKSYAQQPPGQSTRPDDPDMGDDNASTQAILTVCTSDTPAAERSAICDRGPMSPE